MKGLLNQEDVDRIIDLIKNHNLPIKSDLNPKEVFEAMKKDKKREGDFVNFVLLKGIGNAIVEKVSYKELEQITYEPS